MNISTTRFLVRGMAVAGAVAACAVLGTGIAAAATPADSILVMTLAPDNGAPALTFPIDSGNTEVTVTAGSDEHFNLSANQASLNGYTEVDDLNDMGFTVTVTDNGVVRDTIPLSAQANLFFRA